MTKTTAHAQTQIQVLLEETRDAFHNYYGGVNTDFADFATIALADFRKILGNPDLTDRELKALIRRAGKRRRSKEISRDCWASYTASYMAKRANSNKQFQTA